MTTLDATRGSLYADLSRQVRLAGLLERRSGYYTMRISATVAAYAAVWVAVVLVGESWWLLALAPAMAIVYTQLAFVGHDAGHRQILRGRRANDLLGLIVGNLGVGLSYGWWIDKHNRHHANPNHEGKDPDIGAGAIVFTTDAGAGAGVASPAGSPGSRRTCSSRCCSWRGSTCTSPASARCCRRPRDASPRRRGRAARRCTSAATSRRCSWCCRPGRRCIFIVVHQGLFGLLHGLLLRAQPQGHADPGRRRRSGLPAPAGADLPQRPRRAGSSTSCSAA